MIVPLAVDMTDSHVAAYRTEKNNGELCNYSHAAEKWMDRWAGKWQGRQTNNQK